MTPAISGANPHAICQRADTTPMADHHAALFALANGLVGIKGSLEECAHAPDCVMPSAYVTRAISYHEAFPGYADATETRVLCPSPVAASVCIDGTPVDFSTAQIVAFDRHLDLDTGILHRRTLWRLADGRQIDITAQRLVPLDGGPVVASRLRVAPVGHAATLTLAPRFGLGGPQASGAQDDPRISARVAGQWQTAPAPAGLDRFVSGDIALDYRSRLEQTAPDAYDRVVEITPAGAAHTAPLPDFDTLAAEQTAFLRDYWAQAACTVEGDAALTQALRFNLFQVMQSASRDPAHGTAAKGLTGDGYEGHTFWDTEAFMLPALAFTAPERARCLLDYRVRQLDAARANARLMGHACGALYPWRTIAGRECSSHYPTGAAQYHINADIAFALQLYVEASDDRAFLAHAADMLFETARIWLEIGHFDARRSGAFCIHGVTGPDEYTALVDNDFYTNAAARAHLAFAAVTARQLGRHDAEAAQWQRAADAMWLPVDAALGINPQDDSFLSKPAFAAPLRVPGRPLLMAHHPMVLFRHQVCKQGDVVQAMAMGLIDPPLSRAAANYAYYEPITSHDSTLSAPGFGVVAARVGAFADARHFLEEAAFVDIENRHHNTDHGLHMAALAGSWLALAQGWTGLRIASGDLHFRPQSAPELPAHTLRLQWRGSVLAIEVGPEGAHYRVVSGGPVALFDHGRALTIGAEAVFAPRPTVRALIFDLDGVLTDTAEDHYEAWAELCRRHGWPFDRAFNEKLKGVDRAGSLRLILDAAGVSLPADTFAACLAEKNAAYVERLAAYTPAHLFAGVHQLFAAARAAGLKIALASASRNAPEVIARLGIADQFDYIADAASVAHPKPAPDIFLACAAALGVPAQACIGIEDAQAGVEAICAAGMTAIGIGTTLHHTAFNLRHLSELTLSAILAAPPKAG